DGGRSHSLPVDSQYAEPGRFGQAYRFEPAYANLLTLPQSLANPADLIAGPDVRWSHDETGAQPVLTAARETADAGLLWQTQVVELQDVPARHRRHKAFLGSVYL